MNYLAIDLGASSGRVMVVSKQNKITLNQIKRFQIKTIRMDDYHTQLDIDYLMHEVTQGIEEAFQQYPDIASIGIDTWGVDYGYVYQDNSYKNPYFYRSLRTKRYLDDVHNKCSKDHLYLLTGIQHQYFNTVYQMYTDTQTLKHKKPIKKALLLPDLLAFLLTGEMRLELTNLSTTGLYNPINHEFIRETDQLTFGRNTFAKMIYPTETYGLLKQSFGHPNIPIVAVCTHDTASAIASLPLQDHDIYISSGSWSLLGTLLKEPVMSPEAKAANFSNEVGINHRIRFLKNINGLFIANHVIAAFKQQGTTLNYDLIYEHIAEVTPFSHMIDVNHPLFENPNDMIGAIQSYCKQTNQHVPQSVGEIFRALFESLALKYMVEIEQLSQITNKQFQRVYVFGGGGQIDFINQLLANLTSLEVIQGPREATVLGNGIVQMLTNKDIVTLSEGQKLIQDSFGKKNYKSIKMDIEKVYKTYKEIVERGIENVNS